MSGSLYATLLGSVAGSDAPLVEWKGREYSYGAVKQTAGRFATALRELGVEPGDRVAIQIEKCPEFLFIYLATLQLGAALLPLNTGYQTEEVQYFLSDAEPKVCVVPTAPEPELRAAVHGLDIVISALDSDADDALIRLADGSPSMRDFVAVESSDLAAILYTSGTTGKPKGAMLTHGNLATNARTLTNAWHMTADDRLLHALPLYHTHGLFVAINSTMVAGGRIALLPKFDARAVIDALPSATVFMGVPTFYTRLLAQPELTRERVENMRLFTSGSAPLRETTFAEFEERTGHQILERYGLTETNMNTSNPYDGERRPGTVGQPLPGIEVKISDPDTGQAVPPGQTGMIEVRGPNVFAGYWNLPDKTAADLRENGYFITGDLGVLDGDDYLSIVGRSKDLVITGGLNVYPKEIELALDAFPGVLESAIFGVSHPDLGEAVTAVFVADDPAVNEDELIAQLKSSLAGFKVPKRLFRVDALPRNTMGKVQKNVLRSQYRDTYES